MAGSPKPVWKRMAVNPRVQEATKGAVLNGREPLVADKWRSMGKGGG